MPRTSVATSLGREVIPTTLDQLLERGRAQGHLSLPELREAFTKAGVGPAEGRTILRELAEAGVELAAEEGPKTAPARMTSAKKAAPAGKTRRTKASAQPAEESPQPSTAQPSTTQPSAAQTTTSTKADGETVKATKTTKARKTRKAAEADLSAGPEEAEPPTDLDPETAAEAAAGIDTGAEDADGMDLDDNTSVMGDSVHTYLKSIGRRTLLTAAQEVELAKRIEAGLYAEYKLETALEDGRRMPPGVRDDLEWVIEDGRRAKDHMLEANLRLVVSVAKKYTDRGMSLLDVVQEGNLGLIRAVEKFDYTKGYKFSTYAMWWIRQAIQRGFADSARTIRLPVHVLEMLSKLSRVERDMHQRLGREPTPEELAVELDKTPDQIEELLRTSRQPISLDSTIGEDGETRIGDLIEDVDSPEASEVVDRQLLAEQLKGVLGNLSPREAKIMSLRFGLTDGKPHTLDEIGKHLGLTRERIRQLEKESLSKLRHPSNTRPLLDWAS
ncbi:RNA polymerase sigma factor [Sphaerimonospora thailandensis]|uniref:RNA polymerase sigma factor n=1 Tax=Sphaerimonospora thailandensis TaxID=795644 RepID=A0A8J3VY30_9ACTN|nr:RNA polymerase sigma factor [Sphaerimonospora thailandensis]GIH68540.1 RNA polymerase principal sigma factor HrdB [Sphaerimonospora thailandensis]